MEVPTKKPQSDPVCERLALGRTSSCKILPRLLLMAVRIDDQTNCINGAGTLRSESVTHGRTDVRCEHSQTVIQLSHCNVDSLLLRMASINVGTLRGRADEVVEMLERRSVDVCYVQEIR